MSVDEVQVEGNSVEVVGVQVMNGYVHVGDEVAYATRHASTTTMNIGTVTGFGKRAHPWKDEFQTTLQIHVTHESSWGSVSQENRNVTVTEIHRVVRLGK